MSSAPDPDQPHNAPPNPASQAELAALAQRVAHLEAQLAALAPTRTPASAALPYARAVSTPVPLVPSDPPPLPAPILLPTQPPPARPVLPPPPPRQSFEDRLGSQIFNFIGAAALIIGASWALKLAFEHGLIGPAGRILIGLAAGAALILWSERFRRRSLPAFSYSLKAVGSGILYLALWASFQLYHLLPSNAVFAAMLLVTAWNAFMAWSQDAELLAAYALAGGLATPLLLSTGGDHETFLFLYLATLDAATVLLLRFKPWPRLLPPTYLATVFYFIAWYSRYFHPYVPFNPRQAPVLTHFWDAQSTETTLFILLFAAIFALPLLRHWIKPRTSNHLEENSVPHSSTASPSMSGSTTEATPSTILTILLPLANAAFLSLSLYSVFQDSGLHATLPWLMLTLSALYLALMRLQATAASRALHLALAVIFLTVAIPLKASGHTLTTAWLVEGLVLYWVSGKLKNEAKASTRILHLLSGAGYILGLLSLAIHWFWFNPAPQDTFFNHNLAAALIALASLAGLAWLASRPNPNEPAETHIAPLTLSFTAIDLVALLLLLGELSSFTSARLHPAFRGPDFLNALLALAVLAATSWSQHRLGQSKATTHPLDNRLGAPSQTVSPSEVGSYTSNAPLQILAASSLIAFNLFALLTGVREISALWSSPGIIDPDAALQRSLAISAFLMLYGAALLAAGFWRRSAFVRWQGLILLIFTILKVFLYDVSGLSQGYRVASFLGLGALLMAVSFAYQKDWLGLKAPPATATAEDPA